MNRRLVVGLMLGLGLMTTGWAVALVAATPDEALRRPFLCPGQPEVEAKNIQVLTTRKWSRGILALYRGSCLSEAKQASDQKVLSYRVMKQTGVEWRLSSSSSYFMTAEKSKPVSLIEYGVGHTVGKGTDRQTILYGQVLSPQVSAVEVTFNNGKSLRDESPDGLFALVAPGATGICDIRVFGYDNQILQRNELISPRRSSSRDGNTCQAISGQL
ncbi:MAG: hypothetical protein LH660_13770 [Phormidesmis sp. CAN_BIN36]|nr:hypothetical protein [Phormidesmis sp. CAN_BIN36]